MKSLSDVVKVIDHIKHQELSGKTFTCRILIYFYKALHQNTYYVHVQFMIKTLSHKFLL